MKHPLWSALLVLLLAGCAWDMGTVDTPPAQVETDVDPNAWVTIPAGSFLYGQHNDEILVAYNYEMMVTDVTNSQYASYLNEAQPAGWVDLSPEGITGYYPGDTFRGYKHEEEITPGDYLHLPLSDEGLHLIHEEGHFWPRPGYEMHPMVLVSWFGAKAYCDFYGWRLPTEVEWEKAARGPDDRPFPWGYELARNNANYYSSHDLFEKIAGGAGGTTPVGFYNGKSYDGYQTLASASPYGLYDMAGNVWQWTGDVYEDQHYRYLRGGSKENYGYNLRVWTRNSAGPEYHSPSVGFRCARPPQGE